MDTRIISDVHIGSRYLLTHAFTEFLTGLPPGSQLVMNGDVMNRWHAHLPPEHERVLDLLRQRSQDVHIVWVRGNHDRRYILPAPARIEFQSSFAIDKRLFAAHGHSFDTVMPRSRLFIKLFRVFHHLRIALGAERVHVAYYAKRFGLLYNVLRKFFRRNAVEFAKQHGYGTVVCGHTHYPEDSCVDGIRYLNTGAWTETPLFFVKVSDMDITLEPIPVAAATAPASQETRP